MSVLACGHRLVYYPYMASVAGKKRGNATYYYLVESARVDGKPRIVSQEYLGTADELAAAMRGGGLGLPDRTQHSDFGAVAAAWGVLEDLGVAALIDEAAGRGGRRRRVRRYVPGAGRAEPGSGTVLEAGVRGLVGQDGGAAVHRGARHGPGPPPVLGCDALRHAGAAGAGQRRDRAAGGGGVRAGLLVGGAGHDELRHLHRHGERQGVGPHAARPGKTQRPAAGGAGPGGHPGRGDPADLARLPRQQAGRHPVPGHHPQLKARYEPVTAACGQQPADIAVVFDAGQNSETTSRSWPAPGWATSGRCPPATART